MKNLTLSTLVELFGNHYGTNFSIMGTPMNDITSIMNLVDEGELSPLEIHQIVTK